METRYRALDPLGARIETLPEIDSTNAEAARRAEAGEPGPLWIRAFRQTAGRGRRGRAWRSGAGDLLTTLLLRPNAPPAETATLSFIAALALADAVDTIAPGAPTALKWPNDVLLDGRKIAGVLLEAQEDWVAIGVGLNVAAAPDAAALPADAAPAGDLSGYLAPGRDADDAMAALTAAMGARVARWSRDGFAGQRAEWRARAVGLGGPLIARLPKETIEGRFVDVDASGALVLETRNGERRVTAADVYFP